MAPLSGRIFWQKAETGTANVSRKKKEEILMADFCNRDLLETSSGTSSNLGHTGEVSIQKRWNTEPGSGR